MLSEEEKREWLEMAASPEVRADFDRLSRASAELRRARTPDAAVAFLGFMARLAPSKLARPAWRETLMLL
jgi:hypothetical protein